MHPRHLSIREFSYDLPDDRIAKHPLIERDSSKLLIYKNGYIENNTYRNIDKFLPGKCLLVFNNTKVVQARILFEKPTGGIIEVFCLEPGESYSDLATAMLTKGEVYWKCLVGGASKWKHGTTLQKRIAYNNTEFILEASVARRLTDSFVIKLRWMPGGISFAEMLHYAGTIPLPPYLQRESEEEDKTRYQTIYADHGGSVAAPTAGLHFTREVFGKLEAKNIEKEFVTLHVGAGTFRPVKSETMEEHDMHAEFMDVSVETIAKLKQCRDSDQSIVAVGTTSLRTIESLYWMGVKVLREPALAPDEVCIQQWDPYDITQASFETNVALNALLDWMHRLSLSRIITKTKILIAPGYKLRVAKGLVTNFHQPNSTLLLLVAAIVGDNWKEIYKYALNNDYRFLSYGDGCLLLPDD